MLKINSVWDKCEKNKIKNKKDWYKKKNWI